MFNKGLDSSEKQEGLLKRLKNIADKTDNQLKAIKGQNNELDLVKNQKTKQSDPIDKIKFSDEKLNKLDDVMKKTKKCEDEDLEYTVAKGDKYNVNPYKNLEIFVKKIVNGEMSVKKAKEQPDELWNEIFKMKEGASKKKKGRKFSTKNKRIILNLIKGGNDLHNIRDKIINVFEEKSRVKF